jgi:hypothetical protein
MNGRKVAASSSVTSKVASHDQRLHRTYGYLVVFAGTLLVGKTILMVPSEAVIRERQVSDVHDRPFWPTICPP